MGSLRGTAQVTSSPCPEKSVVGNCELEAMRLAGHLMLPRGQNLSDHFWVLSESK